MKVILAQQTLSKVLTAAQRYVTGGHSQATGPLQGTFLILTFTFYYPVFIDRLMLFINRCFACLMITFDVCHADFEISFTLLTLSIVFSSLF